MPTVTASVVRVHDTRQYPDGGAAGYGSGDSSGLAYVPGLNALLIADSEHDESPYNSSTNLFAVSLDGTFIRSYSLTSFTQEPTGLAYNSYNGYLYITDDDLNEVFWVDPAQPSVRIGQFDTSRLGFTDTEDLKFDPATGHIFILDGVARRLHELTAQGEPVGSIALPAPITDAEALAYDPTHDVFFVASGASPTIWMVSRTGEILDSIDVLAATSYRNPVTGAAPAPKGFELAPSSNPNDGTTLSLYVADYGVDQQHDGRVFEIGLGPDWLMSTVTPPSRPNVTGAHVVGTAGNDTIMLGTGANWHIGANNDLIEGLTGNDRLGGAGGNDWLYGGDGKDRLYGNGGDDHLWGGAGNDFMKGGAGHDTFVFNTKLGTSKTDRAKNFDTITDFSVKQDSLWLDDAVFKKLKGGSEAAPKKLLKTYFETGTEADDRNDYVLYNKKTGVLSYDADGSGNGKAVEFAKLDKNLKLSHHDFFGV